MTAIVSVSHAVRGKLPIRDKSWLDEPSPSVHALAELASPPPYFDHFGTAVGS